MANNSNTSGKIKCSSRVSQCEIWILFIMCLSKLPCTLARQTSDDNTVAMYPEGDIYVRYGEDLEIFCKTEGNFTSEDLEFTLAGNHLHSQVVNKSTIRLFVPKPKEHSRVVYYCKNKANFRNALKSVYVASPPAEVKDFKCISKNLEAMNCSWTTPDLIIFTNYTLTFLIYGTPVKKCVANLVDNSLTRYCYWNTTSQPRYRQQEEKYYFSLEAHNAFETRTQKFIIDHYSVVKPDAPRNLQNVSESPHSVVLHWELPINMDLLMGGVEHRIEYQIAKIDDTSVFRRVNTTGLPPNNKTYRFTINDLPYAHMQYGVRVYIKPNRAKSDEFWSDYSFKVFDTASEIPSRPPETVAGAFAQAAYEYGREVNIYWKQLEEYEEAGANFTYKVLIQGQNEPMVKKPDKSRSLGFLYLERASLEAMEISIWSVNEKGSSINSSHLYIPAERETNSLHLNSFTKLAYENGTYELSWVGIENIDNYTLFWCQHNATDICTGRISFMVLEPNKNKHIINLPRDYRYQFAISANNGTRTSGMVWAKCDISKEGITMYRFPIRFTDHDAPGKSFVKLRWSMDCTLKDSIIRGYNITYCPVIRTSSLCDDTIGNQSKYINGSKQMEVNITGLLPYKTYQFSIALDTKHGQKTIENTTVRITTLEDTPTSPQNVSISDVESNSLVIFWYPPEHINGHITKINYEILDYNNSLRVVKAEERNKDEFKKQLNVTLDGLDGFRNYSLSVKACNEGIGLCSKPTDSTSVRTRIGSPGKIEKQPVLVSNRLSWEKPKIPGGTLDQYQIEIVKDEKEPLIINTTELSYTIKTSCEGEVQTETYRVRAVNFDEDGQHGASADSSNVILPTRSLEETEMLIFPGSWSPEAQVRCINNSPGVYFIIFIFMGVLALIALGCGLLKAYRKVKKMGDIKPEFPKGLFVPEKDMSKYTFGGLYPSEKDEKPNSDESLLLPNTKTTVSTPEIKQIVSDNCGSSDHTDSTVLSDASQNPMDRKNSTSDDDSHSSLNLEVETVKADGNIAVQEDSASSETESSCGNSPYFSDNTFKKNNAGYVQPVMNPVTGHVQTAPAPLKSNFPKPLVQPGSSSYVMAGLSPPMFSTGPAPPSMMKQPPHSSGYLRPEDIEASSALNFPKLGPSPTKAFGTESLPPMPTLPPLTKHADSSYIQLQSLDSLPSRKPTVGSNVPFKTAPNGYVSPGDAVINKHLKHIISSGQPAEESAILDPAMSPDAYCRFSWSTDPANDNLHSLLTNSPTVNTPKN